MDKRTHARVVALYEEHQQYLYHKVMIIFNNSAAAQDIVQEVFIKVMDQLSQGNEHVFERRYLVRMATNLCIDRLRSRKIRSEYPHEGIEELFHWNHDLSAGVLIRQILEKIPARLREIAVYHLIDGYAEDEIVALTGLAKRTLQRRIHKIRKIVARLS